MPTDRLLITLLRGLQSYTDQQDTQRLLSTSASVLATLSNPRNLTLLTSQLLTSQATWTRPPGLRLCLRFMGVFQSTAYTILTEEKEEEERRLGKRPPRAPGQPLAGGGIPREDWIKAVIQGADERSPRWRHILVFAGLLLGFQNRHSQESEIPEKLRRLLGDVLLKRVNLALGEVGSAEELGSHCITLVLNYSFQSLSDLERSSINYHRLLPVLIGTTFFSSEGYRSAYFLGPVSMDIRQSDKSKFAWSSQSRSFRQVSAMSSSPLVSSMGPVSRLIAHTIENTREPWLIQTAMDDLQNFARILDSQWCHNKLSEIDRSEEHLYLDTSTSAGTLPMLWKVLRSILFATTIVLRSILGRLLADPVLASGSRAPDLGVKTLHILRQLHFITNRLGAGNSFSQYAFVNLTAIDILSMHPAMATQFLGSIRPSQFGRFPIHPYERNLDLFFLNTAEHFTLVLGPETNENLLLAAAAPYLNPADIPTALPPAAQTTKNFESITELFESAHSLTLAIISAPQNTQLAVTHLPFYVDTLFRLFPGNVSSRQLRLAFKTLIRLASPPNMVCAAQPELAPTLLELLRFRAERVGEERQEPYKAPSSRAMDQQESSEWSTLILALIDSLPVIAPALLYDWLSLTAELLQPAASNTGHQIHHEGRDQLRACVDHFWEMLSGGEMDVERSAICAAWWGTDGGRAMVLGQTFGQENTAQDDDVTMSGALPPADQHRESKL